MDNHYLRLFKRKPLYAFRAFVIGICTLTVVNVYAQPPNDSPCMPTVAPLDGSCQVGTTIDAEEDIDDPSCMQAPTVSVWYELNLDPNSDELTIDLTNLNIPASALMITNLWTFVPDCGGTTSIVPGASHCDAVGNLNFNVTGLLGGTTYYFQVGTSELIMGDFNICFTESGPPPPPPCPSPGIDCPNAELLMNTGAPFCVQGCTAGSPSYPTGSGDCFDMPNETTWFYFGDLPPGPGAPWRYNITVTSPDITEPQVAIFRNCPLLEPLICETGANGEVEFLFDPQEFTSGLYYIAISSEMVDNTGEFELCIEPFQFIDCNTDSEIEIVNTSLGSPLTGPFLPGEEVEVCFYINNFNSGSGTGCNFLHGIVPTFGAGWDPVESFVFNGEPANITEPITNNTNEGGWQWFTGFNIPTYNLPNGSQPQGSPTGLGWYYVHNHNPACVVPACSPGDGIDPMFCLNNGAAFWQVCFTLTVRSFPECQNNDDLSITFETFGDSETGSNPNPGCWEDEIWTVDFDVNCCQPPTLNPPPVLTLCETGTAFFPLTSDLDPGVDYTWTVSPNSVGATGCAGGCPNEINQVLTNNSPVSETVIYTVTPVASATGCVGGQTTYIVNVDASPSINIVPPLPICPGGCANINTVVTGGQPPYDYLWTGGSGLFGANPQACPIDSTMYYLTVTDANQCTSIDSVLVEVSPVPIPEIVTSPDVTEICENDPEYPIELTAEVTNDNGSFYLYNWGAYGSGIQTIEAEVSDFYMLTVTDALTQCTGETFIGITVHPAPVATIDPVDPICGGLDNFCLTGAPIGGLWESNDVFIDGAGCFDPSAETPGIKNVCYTYIDAFTSCDSTICIDIEITTSPLLTDPGDITICDSYTLPAIDGVALPGTESYFDAPNGGGTMYSPGDVITSTQQLYIYADDGSGLCGDELSFTITVDLSPVVDDIVDVENCGSYTLPSITGANLTGNEAFFDQPGGTGNSYDAGDIINASTVLYIYDENNDCDDEQSFQIDINPVPNLDAFQNVEACNEYTLQGISGSNLTGNQAYYTQSGGLGTSYNPGDIITASVTLYAYDEATGSGNCSDEVTLDITIFEEPDIDPQGDVTACDQYTLPPITGTALTGSEAYFDQPGGNGTQYAPGDVISTDVDLYIFDGTGLSGCFDEETFAIDIISSPSIDPIDDVVACGEYPLTAITGTNLAGNVAYFDQPNGNGTQYNAGDLITATTTLYAYAPTSLNGCFDEYEFTITINEIPTSDFTTPATICETDFATITYTGTASAAANYSWNFNGGTILSGTGAGPYEIEWNAPGTYTIGLTVEENGCTSELTEMTITVDPELNPPTINCNSTTTSIEFSWADVVGATGYDVTVITGQTGTLLGNTYTFTGLTPGETVEIQVEALGNGACGNSIATLECTAQNCPSIQITIDPVADICHDGNNPSINLNANVSGGDGSGNGTWSGAFVSPAGVFDAAAAGPGSHVVTYTFDEAGCTFFESITINSFAVPSSAFALADEICEGNTTLVTYQGGAGVTATYDWDFGSATIVSGSGQGPYEISWPADGPQNVSLQVTENGCTSPISTETITVIPPLEAPVIICNSTAEEIVFSWADVVGASGYTINVISGPGGTQNGNTYTVSGLNANDMVTIEVIAVSSNLCPDASATQTCSALDCPAITIAIDPVDDICLDGNNGTVDLNATVSGSNGTGTGFWSPSAVVDPVALGAGTHVFVYTHDEAGCSFSESISINIFETPTADFTITPEICQGNNASISFTGTAGVGATYNWDFAGGTVVSGTGSGPYEVTFDNPGTFNVSLQIEENNCISNSISYPIEVNQPLAAPVINCNSSAEEIEFSWDDVPGASGYDVVVISGPSGTQNGNTYTVTGLNANDMVTIQVTAIDPGPCPDVSSTQTCSALDCPPITITIDPVDDICLDGNNGTIDLNATVSGSNGTGMGSWSPSAVVDPVSLGAGTHVFVYTFEEAGCTFNESISINIFQTPIADFTITPEICQGDNASVSFTGTAGAGATYNWDFAGGTVVSGTGVGPYEVTFDNPGTFNVSLQIEENNCISNSISYPIEVNQPLAAPVINCNSSAEEIEFSWDDVPGASGYNVVVISGPSGTQNGNTYTVTGLNANDMVTIQVTAIDDGPCPNVSATQTCSALDCPSVTIDIDPVDDICLDGNNGTIDLNATVSGSNGTGAGSWSPSAVVDPVALGAGTHVFVYTFEEVGCTFNASISINIFQTPTADFTITPVICQGDNASISFTGTAGAGAVYNWDFAGGTVVSGTGAGPYEVTFDNPGTFDVSLQIEENNCISNTISYPIEVNQPLAAPVINCNSTTEEIEFSWDDVPGASGYSVVVISGPTGVQAGNTYTVSGLSANDMVTIQVTAIDDGPCPDVSATQTCSALDCPPITVDIDAVAPLCLDENAIPFDLNVVVTGSDGSGAGFWTPSGTVNPAALGAGTHDFVYTFEEVGCSYQGSVQVVINALPNAEAGDTDELSCTIENLDLNGFGSTTGPGIDLQWTGPGTIINDQSLTPTIELPGMYYLTVLDNNTGCSATDSVEITQDDAIPLANAGPDSSLTCDFPEIQLQGTGSTGPNYEFEWEGPDIDPTNINLANPSIAEAGTYILTVIDLSNGCTSFEDTVFIVDNTEEPIVVVFPVDASSIDCNVSSVILDGTGSTTDDVTYQWLDPNNDPIAGANDITYEVTVAGIYTLLVTNPFTGCFESASFEVTNTTAFPAADAGPTQQLDCTISSVTLDGSASDSGPNISYEWTGPAGGITGPNTNTMVAATLPGLYTLTVLDNTNGCTTTATVQVTEDLNGPVADAGTDIELDCDFNPVELSGANSSSGANYSYAWFGPNGNPLGSNTEISTNQLGIYAFVVTDNDNDCRDTAYVAVLENSNVPYTAEVQVAMPSCYGENDGLLQIDTVLGGTMPYVYALDETNYTAFNQFNNLESGQYPLSIQDAEGCEWDTLITVGTPQEVTLNLGDDQFIQLGDSTIIEALNTVALGAIDTIIWSPDIFLECLDPECLEVETDLVQTMTFNATIIDLNGCSATDDVVVNVWWDDLIYIPTIFTPNGDGTNDYFFVNGGTGIRQINYIRVFNRWGELVFEKNNIQPNDVGSGWDGSFNGKELSPAVFVYIVEVELDNGRIERRKGDVTLMK